MGFRSSHTEQPEEMNQDDKQPMLMNKKSTVKADGDKITFVAHEGGKSWDVINPETLKDRVGTSCQAERSSVQRQGPDPRYENYDARCSRTCLHQARDFSVTNPSMCPWSRASDRANPDLPSA